MGDISSVPQTSRDISRCEPGEQGPQGLRNKDSLLVAQSKEELRGLRPWRVVHVLREVEGTGGAPVARECSTGMGIQ